MIYFFRTALRSALITVGVVGAGLLYGYLLAGCAEPHDAAHGYVTACFLCDGNGQCTEAPCDANDEAIRPENGGEL